MEVIHDEAGGRDVVRVLEELGRRSIQSVARRRWWRRRAFMDAGMVNKVTFFIAPVIIGGREAPTAVAGSGVENGRGLAPRRSKGHTSWFRH